MIIVFFYHTHHQQVKTIVNIIRLLASDFSSEKAGEPNGVFIVIIPPRKGDGKKGKRPLREIVVHTLKG